MKTIAKFIYSTILTIYDILVLTYIALVCISFHLYFQIKWILQQNKLTFNSFHTTQKINLHHCSSFFSNFFLLLLRPLLLHHQANFHWSPPPPRHPLFPPAQEAGSPPGKGWTPHHFPECSNVIISCAYLYSQSQLKHFTSAAAASPLCDLAKVLCQDSPRVVSPKIFPSI